MSFIDFEKEYMNTKKRESIYSSLLQYVCCVKTCPFFA